MSRQFFDVKEHVVEAQHVREYPRATAHSQDEVLHLAVKQYIPKNNPNPQPGDVTIIGAHANGFVKELYEPLWDDLLRESEKHGFRIRNIWMADVAWQGQSGVLNEGKLGNDPSWMDHSRDLLHLINQFRADMPRPLVGVGHSFGGAVVTHVALMHPRLFTTLVLLDPVLYYRQDGPGVGFSPLALSAVRRDLWPSRADAAAAFRRSKFYASWDPRVLEAWVAHGLRETPTPLYPDPRDAGKATLTTTRHQEVFTYLRPLEQGMDPHTGRRHFDRAKIPDVSDESLRRFAAGNLYRPEVPNVAMQLPNLRPGVLWLFGGQSYVSSPAMRAEKMETTGVGVGGSGGAAAGRVAEVVLEDVGHLVAMDRPAVCAAHAGAWIGKELQVWRDEEAELAVWWRRPDAEKQVLDEQWIGYIGQTKRSMKL